MTRTARIGQMSRRAVSARACGSILVRCEADGQEVRQRAPTDEETRILSRRAAARSLRRHGSPPRPHDFSQLAQAIDRRVIRPSLDAPSNGFSQPARTAVRQTRPDSSVVP